jgi:hypothetical protein
MKHGIPPVFLTRLAAVALAISGALILNALHLD